MLVQQCDGRLSKIILPDSWSNQDREPYMMVMGKSSLNWSSLLIKGYLAQPSPEFREWNALSPLQWKNEQVIILTLSQTLNNKLLPLKIITLDFYFCIYDLCPINT